MYLEIFTLIFAIVSCFIFYMYGKGKGKGKAYYSDYLLRVDYPTSKAYWVNPRTGAQTEIESTVCIVNKPKYTPPDSTKEDEDPPYLPPSSPPLTYPASEKVK